MAGKKKKKRRSDLTHHEFYEGMARVADFVHDRLGNVEEPTGLNNRVEEYVKNRG